MSQTLVIELGRATLLLAVKLAAPMLGFGLLVGLLVSIFQAATQIQEMTLTFIPKILAVFVALAVFGPWMLQNLVSFAASIFSNSADSHNEYTQSDSRRVCVSWSWRGVRHIWFSPVLSGMQILCR